MSGVVHFYVEGRRFTGSNQGEAIDVFECHRGFIRANVFADMPGSTVHPGDYVARIVGENQERGPVANLERRDCGQPPNRGAFARP